MAQINCASGAASIKLACEFPVVAGLLTDDTALGTVGSQKQLENAEMAGEIFDSAIATQLSQLPLATASAGTIVIIKGGAPETFNSLGPILSDRASTVGRHRLFVGFTASQFVFTDVDGSSLGSLPFAYQSVAAPSSGTTQSTTYTSETINANVKIDQFIGVATFGVSKRLDVSAIVPIGRVSLGSTVFKSTSYVVNASNVLQNTYTNPNVYGPGSASGVGDITFNAKGEVWAGERSAVSVGFNFRTPTGDDLNLLGSGSWGYNPYLIYSYLGRISPHARFGYQWNSATELNYSTSTGHNAALPGGMQYDIGADWGAMKRLTLAGDLLGNQYLNAPILVPTPQNFTFTSSTGQPSQFTFNTSLTGNSGYTINDVSVGLKVSPVGNLVLSGNVLVQINNNGLHARPTPLIGISYKF
jgi:hypothetical protein